MGATHWTPAMINQLVESWKRGDKRAVIAADLNVTEGAVCGKLDRLSKAGHIQRRKEPPPTLPVIPRRNPVGTLGACQFIAGDPRIDATKCGKAVSLGESYCEEHRRRCYLPLKGSN